MVAQGRRKETPIWHRGEGKRLKCGTGEKEGDSNIAQGIKKETHMIAQGRRKRQTPGWAEEEGSRTLGERKMQRREGGLWHYYRGDYKQNKYRAALLQGSVGLVAG